jgi:Ornithine/acetylornithine aminotransferase
MIGIEFDGAQTMHAVEQAAFRRGLLVLGAGDSVIRMSPPLVFRPDQAETACRCSTTPSPTSLGG